MQLRVTPVLQVQQAQPDQLVLLAQPVQLELLVL
jgi:hypothetical protein